MKKRIIIGTLIIVLIIGVFATISILQKDSPSHEKNSNITSNTVNNDSIQNNKSNKSDKTVQKIVKNDNIESIDKSSVNDKNELIIKTNLLSIENATELPLSTISTLSSLPQNIQNKIFNIAKSNNIFMTKKIDDKLIIVTDNPNNIRHSVEFVEISIPNGHQINTTLGYNDKMKDSDNDIWEYDEASGQPIRHTKYNSDGDMEFIENWNYSDDPIKYEMKDSDGNIISMRKESLDNGTDLRVEHLVYDRQGNIKINVSASYDGADVKRFTYYNADKPSDSGSIFSEYGNGYKTKESVYSNNLKLINTYTSEYKSGEIKEISVWDSENNEIQKLLPVGNSEAI